MQDILLRLKTLMEQNGINAKKLTKELGISSSSFTDWNKGKGKPSAETLIKLAQYFDVSMDWLLLGIDHSQVLEISSVRDQELLDKFHQLTPELQIGLFMYIDGLLAAMPHSDQAQPLSTSKIG